MPHKPSKKTNKKCDLFGIYLESVSSSKKSCSRHSLDWAVGGSVLLFRTSWLTELCSLLLSRPSSFLVFLQHHHHLPGLRPHPALTKEFFPDIRPKLDPLQLLLRLLVVPSVPRPPLGRGRSPSLGAAPSTLGEFSPQKRFLIVPLKNV